MATLQEIRAKLAEQEKKTSGGGTVSDNAIFPFWNIPEGTTSTLRFLPDSDENNTFFWVERAMIKLPFPGIKGCLLYTSPSPRDGLLSRMPSSA